MEAKDLWVTKNILKPAIRKLLDTQEKYAEKSKWKGRAVGVLAGVVGGTFLTTVGTLGVVLERIIRIAGNVLGAPFAKSCSLSGAWKHAKNGAIDAIDIPVSGLLFMLMFIFLSIIDPKKAIERTFPENNN